jgi:PAS domain S-box-containing protein
VVTYTARNVLRRLEHNLVTPLHSLTRAAQDIAETGNVTIRAAKKSDDEVGQLADVFNAMLDRIQSHEELIEESRIALAEQIESRTAELQKRSLQLQDQIREAGEMEKRYRNLFENNPLPMFVLDLETLKIAAVNNAAVGHYQYAEREFLRTSMLDLTVLDDPLKLVRAFRSTEKTIDAGAWQHRKKNGEVIDVELIAHNILFNGRVGRIVLSKDVTEQNRARRQIEEMNRKLITMSRQAGMAEVATGVLHNVGNVLNSVNVGATVLENLEKRSKFAGVRKVAELLEANAGDLPALFSPGGKGEKLPPFMRSLADQLQAESGERAAELEQLSKNITHIKEIVASQQKFAKVTAAFEIVEAADLFDEALRVVQQDIETNRVRVQREYPTTARVRTDRHKVMQILINLFTNAQQAMLAMPAEDRLLTLKVLPDPEAGKTFLLIRDNGVGIAPDNLTRIFNHGFTTKKDGHGFGLHSSANTATEMGGKLTGHSDGIGTGAEFTLELPAAANSDVA